MASFYVNELYASKSLQKTSQGTKGVTIIMKQLCLDLISIQGTSNIQVDIMVFGGGQRKKETVTCTVDNS